jgi:hypothetical protein
MPVPARYKLHPLMVNGQGCISTVVMSLVKQRGGSFCSAGGRKRVLRGIRDDIVNPVCLASSLV